MIDQRIKLAGRHGIVLDHVDPRSGKTLVPAGSAPQSGASVSTWIPLLAPGMRLLSPSDLRDLAVTSFAFSATRPRLWVALERFLAELASHKVAEEVWVGGSFLTAKLDPNDIDAVVVLSPDRLDAAGAEVAREIYEGLLDQATLLATGIDASAMFVGDSILRAYWQGVFGFGQETTAKGIAVVPFARADR